MASEGDTKVSYPAETSSAVARGLWATLLIAGSVVLSAKFSCATPFAALATLAALGMKRTEGLVLVLAVWAANQIVGYGFLGYPHELQSYAWGLAIGGAAIAAYVAARTILGSVSRIGHGPGVVLALLAAFAAYELVLLAATLVLPSSEGAFAMSIVAKIGLVNALAFVVLVILHRMAATAGFLPQLSSGPIVGSPDRLAV